MGWPKDGTVYVMATYAPRFDATWTTGGFFNTNNYSSMIALDKPTLTVAGTTYAPIETHTSQGEGLSSSEVATIYHVPAGQAVMTLSGTARHESTLTSDAGEGAPKIVGTCHTPAHTGRKRPPIAPAGRP